MQTVFVYGTLLQKLNNYHYIENHVYKTESGIVKGFFIQHWSVSCDCYR